MLSRSFEFQSCGKTDVGRQRESNQDSIYIDSENGVFILADGMGGHQGGERASMIATEVAGRLLSERRKGVKLGDASKAGLKGRRGDAWMTTAAILKADEVIMNAGASYPELKGMGSTIEALYINGGSATIGHVGDSRVYHMRDGVLRQLTEDHSILNEIVKSGTMTEEEAERYPFKNKITHALGHLPDKRVDIFSERVEPGDIFLMCSDGLTNVVSDGEIRGCLAESEDDPWAVCEDLVGRANEGGGPDNISVIVVRVTRG